MGKQNDLEIENQLFAARIDFLEAQITSFIEWSKTAEISIRSYRALMEILDAAKGAAKNEG